MTHDDKKSARPPQRTAVSVHDASPTKYSEPNDAQRIRDLLLRANLSQRAGARELGVDERTMRYWCAGQNTPPRMAFLALERLVDLNRQVSDARDSSFSGDAARVTETGSIVFTALRDGAVHQYEIVAATLLEYFGATSRDPADLLRAFNKGRHLIQDAVRRKQPPSGAHSILGPDDFEPR
jgi:DNA-binding transcriptional regulator YiaG